jgi:metal-responsive CopG/Arc/MetJ family transcriptional regulator
MKVAISVPDDVFETAERARKAQRLPRSRFYSQALESYLKNERRAGVPEALAAVYDRGESSGVDPVLEALQAQALREEW